MKKRTAEIRSITARSPLRVVSELHTRVESLLRSLKVDPGATETFRAIWDAEMAGAPIDITSLAQTTVRSRTTVYSHQGQLIVAGLVWRQAVTDHNGQRIQLRLTQIAWEKVMEITDEYSRLVFTYMKDQLSKLERGQVMLKPRADIELLNVKSVGLDGICTALGRALKWVEAGMSPGRLPPSLVGRMSIVRSIPNEPLEAFPILDWGATMIIGQQTGVPSSERTMGNLANHVSPQYWETACAFYEAARDEGEVQVQHFEGLIQKELRHYQRMIAPVDDNRLVVFSWMMDFKPMR